MHNNIMKYDYKLKKWVKTGGKLIWYNYYTKLKNN